MTEQDIAALNSCPVGKSVTLSDGRRIKKQAWPNQVFTGQCPACVFVNDETCRPLKCVEDEGFAIFVEVSDE